MDAPTSARQHGIPRTISREEMANLPIRRYEGRICVVAMPEELEEARSDLQSETVVGLDTETRPGSPISISGTAVT